MSLNIPDALLRFEELYTKSPYKVILCKLEGSHLNIMNAHKLVDVFPGHFSEQPVDISKLFNSLQNKPEYEELIGISKNDGDWIQKILYINYNNEKRYFDAQIFSPVKGYIAFLCRDITDNYEKETKIGLQDATMRNILDNSKDIHFCISYFSNKLEYVSPAIRDILGYSPSKFQDVHPSVFFELLHPEDIGVYKNFWKEIPELEEQQVFFFKSEFRIRHKDGNYIWLSQYHNLISKAGNPHYLICSLRDITEIKETETALRESEERYSFAFDAANDGLWDYDIITNKVFLSDSWFRIMGYERKEFGDSVTSLYEIIHPDDRECLRKREEEFIQSDDETLSFILRMKHYNKEYKWISSKGKKVLWDGKGNVTRIVGIHTDITERMNFQNNLKKKNEELESVQNKLKEKNTELLKINKELEKRNKEIEDAYKKLVEQELVFRQISENIGDVFWIQTDSDILYLNTAFEEVWGRKRDEVLINPGILKDFIYHEDRDKFDIFTNFGVLKKTSPYILQFRIVTPDGKIRWIWLRLFPIIEENGQIKQAAGIASDITNQKEFESTLKLAKERAQESDRLKSTFLANISHEIRTPMNGIIGFADLLSRKDLEEDIRSNYLNIIKKSSEQLVRVIDDIVEFAKIESKQIAIHQSTFDLNKLLRDINLSYLNYIKNTGITINLRMQPAIKDDVLNITSDELRVRQVLSSLIDNALKYTEKGYVEYGYEIRDDDIQIFVRDTGIGIKEEVKEFIFQRFRQGDEGHTRKYGGTGLGLSICKGLIELLKGKIWFDSEEGKGSVFYFTIPLNPDKAKSAEEDFMDYYSEDHGFDWHNKKILIVEDDELNYEYLYAVLEETNASISHAADGSEAVRMATGEHYDMILMDIRLPVLNGLEATKRIRQMEINTPIIAQTAFSLDDDKMKSMEAGCNDYITKPVSQTELLTKINKLLKPSL